MDKLLNLKTVIPIGSRVWGGSTEESDFDYVIKARHIVAIENMLDGDEYTNVDWHIYDNTRMYNTASVKYDVNGSTVNLIFYPDKSIKIINRLNLFMKSFDEEALAVKNIRVALVEMFCDRHLKPAVELEVRLVEEIMPWEEGYNG